MKKNPNNYWMYSKYSIESALLNPRRKVLEFLVDKNQEDYYKNFINTNVSNKKNLKLKISTKDNIINKIGKLAKYQGAALLVEKLSLNSYKGLKEENNYNLILIIDKLNDPKNFGALIRVSYAFGVCKVIVLDRYMPEETAYIASVASGALDKINILKVKNIVNTIKYFKQNGWWVIGLESKNLSNCVNMKSDKPDFNKKVLVIGSENKGIRNLVSKNCDILFRIPIIKEDANSINIVQALSISLYELS